MRLINHASTHRTGLLARRLRRTHLSRASLAGLLVVGLVAGCGGSSSSDRSHQAARTSSMTSDLAAVTTNRAARSTTTATEGAGHRAHKPTKPSMLAFAKCMRAHGVPDFPDPHQVAPPHGGSPTMQAGPSGGFTANPNSPAYQRASKACGSLAVASPVSDTQGNEMQAAQLKFSACMRTHGVPSYPDPTSSGEIGDNGAIPGVNQNSPAFRAAETKCNTLRPQPPGVPGAG